MTTTSLFPELFGKDGTTGLVGLHLDADHRKKSSEAHVVLYLRKDGILSKVVDRLYPFFFLTDLNLLKRLERTPMEYRRLEGDAVYRYLVYFEDWHSYWRAIGETEDASRLDAHNNRALYLISDPLQQYLLQSGKTFFKGLDHGSIHRAQIALSFNTAANGAREISYFGLSRTDTDPVILELEKFDSEAQLLETAVEIIRRWDPDVLEGHNIFRFDLPLLLRRCRELGVYAGLGRDGSEPHSHPSSFRFGDRAIPFSAFHIPGRQLVDTLFLSMSHDVRERNLDSYDAMEVAREFGLNQPNFPSEHVARNANVPYQNRLPDNAALMFHRLKAVDVISRELSTTFFYQSRLVPMPYEQVARSGMAAKIEGLMVREYLRNLESLPEPGYGAQTIGGFTEILVQGLAGPVLYVDIEHLYPTLMLRHKLGPRSDRLNVFLEINRGLLGFCRNTNGPTHSYSAANDDREKERTAFESIADAMFGQLGYSQSLFNDFEVADRIAQIGQSIVRQLMDMVENRGGKVIEVDTDALIIMPPKQIKTEIDERDFVVGLQNDLPDEIQLIPKGRYKSILSLRKKNYALLDYSGNVILRGSSLSSRTIEPFGHAFITRAVKALLTKDIEGLHTSFLETYNQIVNRDWTINDFARTDILRVSLDQYRTEVQQGSRPHSAAYEVDSRVAEETGQTYTVGNRITYYFAGSRLVHPSYTIAKSADRWSDSQPDECTPYYLRRLSELASKFENCFNESDFQKIFSVDDLFGFTADGIMIRTTERLRRTHSIDN